MITGNYVSRSIDDALTVASKEEISYFNPNIKQGTYI